MLRGMVENYEVDRTATANITAANDNVTGYGLGAGVNYKFNKAIEGFADVNYTKGTSGLVYGQTNAYVLNGAGDADENAATSWMVGGVLISHQGYVRMWAIVRLTSMIVQITPKMPLLRMGRQQLAMRSYEICGQI